MCFAKFVGCDPPLVLLQYGHYQIAWNKTVFQPVVRALEMTRRDFAKLQFQEKRLFILNDIGCSAFIQHRSSSFELNY